MMSTLPSSSPAHGGGEPAAGGAGKEMEAPPQVDPFLVEALENPRHRLTVLRMELDIQRFMQIPDQYQFEFQHLSSSYLRCAAHRVAQHYGLLTIVLDNNLDGRGRIIVRKTPESRYPVVCLSGVPVKKPEDEKPGQIKIVIRPRAVRASSNDVIGNEIKQVSSRTMEEREEDYDKARARIFSGCINPEVDVSSQIVAESGSFCASTHETESNTKILEEAEKMAAKDGSSRVAIFKDREKDRSDPDYDRTYQRYFRGPSPDQNFSLGLYHVLQPSYLQYESGFPQLTQMQGGQTSAAYKQSNHIMGSYYTAGCNQTVPWPSPAVMYAQSYDHFRNAVFQAPFYQQPLSFEHHHKC
ncbi:hypothetical protein Taro_044302 [Colocasia esculenta]|uniref:SUZ domain-containing protein n=1 Tax=Colocasia esculenta TaxID=4460 RepID=A0A843X336_COLES|nr:hypothetical protein [Colocasia esculenta]